MAAFQLPEVHRLPRPHRGQSPPPQLNGGVGGIFMFSLWERACSRWRHSSCQKCIACTGLIAGKARSHS